jgi:hypothetical protein
MWAQAPAPHTTSPSVPPSDNAFTPTYLARLREQEEVLTAAEAHTRPLSP